MTGWIDAHHHLWDLRAVSYPWLMAKGQVRFFGDPAPIQRDYLLPEFRADAAANGFAGSVHIQVGAADPVAEARWVDEIASANPDWPMAQVAYCDLTDPDLPKRLDLLQSLPTVRGVRQIVGRAPGEDETTGTNALLDDPRFLEGLRELGERQMSFDLQLVPSLIPKTADILSQAPRTPVALCHAGSPHERTASGLRDWAKALERLSSLPWVRCKISGLGMFDHSWSKASIAPIVETCLEQFGMNRCMFGSNFPVDSLFSSYDTLFEAISEIVPSQGHASVFRQVAAAFYGLEGAVGRNLLETGKATS